MKKRIIVATLVSETAKLIFIVLAFYWIGTGLLVGDWFIVKEYMYPLWLTVPAWIGISYIEYQLMQFICLADSQIEKAERRHRRQQLRFQRRQEEQAAIQEREENYRQWVDNCERFYYESLEKREGATRA